MNLSNFNSLLIIVAFGSLILLSFLLFLNPMKANKKANFWLGASFLLWSTFSMEEITKLVGIPELNSYFVLFLRIIQFFTSIIFYLSVVYFTNPNFKFQKKDLKHSILPFLYLGILMIQFINDSEDEEIINIVLIMLILFQSLFYVTISYFKIRKHQKKVLLFSSDTNEIDLHWLERIIVLMLSITLLILIYNIFRDFATPNGFINLAFLIVIYMIAYYSLKQKEIYPLDEKQRKELISINENAQHAEVKKKIISDENLAAIKQELSNLMLNKKPYLDSELNLIKLADLLAITPHQLSYAINTGFSENFFEFVNKFRVEKAKELLMNNDKGNVTILAIAFESGFNSKTSFNTIFKRFTNQTPSEFKKTSSNL